MEQGCGLCTLNSPRTFGCAGLDAAFEWVLGAGPPSAALAYVSGKPQIGMDTLAIAANRIGMIGAVGGCPGDAWCQRFHGDPMAKFAQVLVALVLVVAAGAFALRYWQLNKPPIAPPPNQPPVVGPMQPRFAESVAGALADRISQQVGRFYADHGEFPAAADFWKSMSGYIEKPLHNPINGSAEVVPMRLDLDARNVGWASTTRKPAWSIPVQCSMRQTFRRHGHSCIPMTQNSVGT